MSTILTFNGVEYHIIQQDSVDHPFALMVDHENNVWVSRKDYYQVYNGDDWIQDKSITLNRYIREIEQAPDQKVWISTSKGVCIRSSFNYSQIQ